MTNEQKLKTVEERVKAFLANREMSSIAALIANEFAHWLALEAEDEQPENCPFCGGETQSNLGHIRVGDIHYWVECISPYCMYRSAHYTDNKVAIAAHNRVCRAVQAMKECEVGE